MTLHPRSPRDPLLHELENFVGAVMIAGTGSVPNSGPSIANTKIAHSKSDGIVSDANTTGGFLQTSYARPDVTFEDIAGKTLADNGACP
jgi:hypothetical protein